ncbi:hypothetical protein A1355_05960 [Methylomonas koyamae]|uniref:Uncharacterized protein n=1 Tax=Methylomonas koyamae TaxID=702114 RepID=A0A177NK86_9GAMM|nr:hypothetical protein A1355_05960 [Methylomonas koyamae]
MVHVFPLHILKHETVLFHIQHQAVAEIVRKKALMTIMYFHCRKTYLQPTFWLHLTLLMFQDFLLKI